MKSTASKMSPDCVSNIARVSQVPTTPRSSLIIGVIRIIWLIFYSYSEILYRFVKRQFGLSPRQLKDKVVLITGAAHGIGYATAELFASQQCVTVLTDVSSKVHEAAKSLEDQGFQTASYQLDVTKPQAVAQCLESVVKRFGRLDILISNAGVLHGRTLLDLTEDQIRSTVDVNLMGTIWVIRAALPHMIRQGGGHIVSVASMSSCLGVAFITDYAASKFGTLGFFEAVEDEVRRMGLSGGDKDKGIQMTLICPTFLDPEAGGVLVGKPVQPGCPSHKLLKPRDVAAKILEAVRYCRRLVCVPESMALAFIAKSIVPCRVARAIQELDGDYFDAK